VPGATATPRVLEELRRRILIGEVLPGEQLRQETLARDLNVSRVPLREALLILANQGLLTHHPNQGFVVTKRTPDELAQVHLLLGLLEDELLSRALVWPNRSTLMRLRNLNKRMTDLVDAQAWIDVVSLNHEFHQILWDMSPLKLVVDEVERVWALADAYIATSYNTSPRRAAAVAEHQAILTALENRDIDDLRAAHIAHRESTRHGADQRISGLA